MVKPKENAMAINVRDPPQMVGHESPDVHCSPLKIHTHVGKKSLGVGRYVSVFSPEMVAANIIFVQRVMGQNYQHFWLGSKKLR